MHRLLVLVNLFVLSITVLEAQQPSGLVNQGNTCFMNGALQCLYNVHELTDFLIKQKDTGYYIKERKGKPTPAALYSDLVYQIRKSAGKLLKPTAFCSNMRDIMGFRTPGIPQSTPQEDAQEFLTRLLDYLADGDINRKVVTERYGFPKNNIPKSFVGRLFNVWLESTFTRLDGTQGKEISFEPQIIVGIQEETLVECKKPLVECLDSFFAEESMIEGGFKKRKYSLVYAPDQLIIVLKRFRFGNLQDKISCPVTFPLKGLALGKYLIEAEKKYAANSTYDLTGVVIHTGGSGEGHYYAYVMPQEDVWYECNDSIVKKVDIPKDFEQKGYIGNNSSATPYILFYKRRGPSVPDPASRPGTMTETLLVQRLSKQGITREQLQGFLDGQGIVTTTADLVAGVNQGLVTLERIADLVKSYYEELSKSLIRNLTRLNANLTALQGALR